MSNELLDAVERVASTFEEFKKVNDKAIEEVEKKNSSRAAELQDTLTKISADLDSAIKDRQVVEKKMKATQERLEILEALNDRPRVSVQDKARNEVTDSFLKCVRTGFKDMDSLHAYKQSMDKARELKAVTIGSTADGGYGVPEQISTAVEALALKMSDIASAVKNVTAGTSDYKELISVHGFAAAWVAETGTRSGTGNANLRERAPAWGELYAYPQVSNWALEDIFFDVVGWLTNDAGMAMAQALSQSIYNGNGTAQPLGFVNTAPTSSADYASPLRAAAAFQYVPCVSASPQAVGADDIIDLVYALAPAYRANARFMMNTVTQGHVRKLKDTTNQYLWQPSLQAGQPDRLLGYPVGTWENLANPTTADGFSVAFGDFSRAYLLVARTGMAIDRNPYGTIGYTSFYLRKRWGGCVLNNDAVKLLKLADS